MSLLPERTMRRRWFPEEAAYAHQLPAAMEVVAWGETGCVITFETAASESSELERMQSSATADVVVEVKFECA